MKNSGQHELEDVFKGLAILAVILGFIVNWTFAFYAFIGASILITINHFRKGDSSGQDATSSNNRSTFTPNTEATFVWPNPGQFNFAIVGESNYQHAINLIVSRQSEDRQIHAAHLIPEDENEYDDKAIRVDIDGRTVGYLSRDSARSFRRRLSKNKLSGKTTGCRAVIIGGHTLPSGKTASYGVWLDLKGFN